MSKYISESTFSRMAKLTRNAHRTPEFKAGRVSFDNFMNYRTGIKQASVTLKSVRSLKAAYENSLGALDGITKAVAPTSLFKKTTKS